MDLASATAVGSALLGSVIAGVAFGTLAALLLIVRRDSRLIPSAWEDAGPVIGRVSVAALILGPFAASAGLVPLLAGLTALCLLLGRTAVYRSMRILRTGEHAGRLLIVGAGTTGRALADMLSRSPDYGLAPIGFIDDVETGGLPAPLLGQLSQIAEIVTEHRVDHIIFTYGRNVRDQTLVETLRRCDELPTTMHVLPRLFELGREIGSDRYDDLRGFPLDAVRSTATRPARPRAKRMFDVVASSVLLLLVTPLLAALAIAIKVSGPGRIIFRQERITQAGRTFAFLKFRTMTPASGDDEAWETPTDRITWIGRLLRPTHLDELPQLYNVLRGDMSLVGPRPERATYVEEFSGKVPGYEHRHRVPTGLTGLAQVNGLWGETSISERARFDNLYIERWSLWADISILLRTPATMLGRQEDAAGEDALELRCPMDTPATAGPETARLAS